MYPRSPVRLDQERGAVELTPGLLFGRSERFPAALVQLSLGGPAFDGRRAGRRCGRGAAAGRGVRQPAGAGRLARGRVRGRDRLGTGAGRPGPLRLPRPRAARLRGAGAHLRERPAPDRLHVRPGRARRRLYDKTAEIALRGVTWLHDLWGEREAEAPVWRLEFQCSTRRRT